MHLQLYTYNLLYFHHFTFSNNKEKSWTTYAHSCQCWCSSSLWASVFPFGIISLSLCSSVLSGTFLTKSSFLDLLMASSPIREPMKLGSVAPPCTAAWKLSKGSKLGQLQNSPLSCLWKITLLCYLMQNVLRIIITKVDIWVSVLFCFVLVVSSERVNLSLVILLPVGLEMREEGQ